MFSVVVNALLRAVPYHSCVDVPTQEAGKKALMASEALERGPKSELGADNLRASGRQAFLPAPSMWD